MYSGNSVGSNETEDYTPIATSQPDLESFDASPLMLHLPIIHPVPMEVNGFHVSVDSFLRQVLIK
jgi:hypothetical protein